MPLSVIDWTKDARDPRAFLAAWCQTVVDVINATSAGELVANLDIRPRAGIVTPRALAESTAPTLVAPARFTDGFGVGVSAGDELVAVVWFVAPDNKADSDASLALAIGAAALMLAGVEVVIVDAMPGPPSWATHLHSLVGVYPLPRRPRNGETPVLVVEPRIEGGAEKYAVWHYAVAADKALPTVPLPVAGATHLAHVTLDLEATYLEACRRTQPSE